MSESRTSMVFQKNLAVLRKSHGYTQKQVGEFCGLSESAISRFESGLRFPEPETIDRLADLYRIAISDLFRAGGAEQKASSLAYHKANLLAEFQALTDAGEIGVNYFLKDAK